MRREEDGVGHRHLRVQSLLLEELRALLRDDVTDPALANVRVAAVVLSVDYRHAKVHFVLEAGAESERRPAERALERATAFLRARIAEAIDMKRVPDLRFVFDGVAT
jgi:ribosome-binding factor A